MARGVEFTGGIVLTPAEKKLFGAMDAAAPTGRITKEGSEMFRRKAGIAFAAPLGKLARQIIRENGWEKSHCKSEFYMLALDLGVPQPQAVLMRREVMKLRRPHLRSVTRLFPIARSPARCDGATSPAQSRSFPDFFSDRPLPRVLS